MFRVAEVYILKMEAEPFSETSVSLNKICIALKKEIYWNLKK
jgi:hypothetical protein